MNKRKMILAAIIGLVVFGSAIYALIAAQNGKGSARVQTVTAGEVKRMPLEASIFTTGRVLAEDERKVYAEVQAGKVKAVLAEEGQKVSKGQVLAELDTADLDDQIKAAQIQLDIAKETLRQLETSGQTNFDLGLKTAEKAAADAQKAYDDKAQLYLSGAVSQAEKDAAASALDRAKTELESARRSYSNYGKDSQIKIQKLSVAAASNTLSQLQRNKEKAKIKAPIDGVVYQAGVKAGDPITLSLPLFSIASSDQLRVACNVSEFDIDQVQLGQKAIIKGDGFEDVYTGRIDYISPVAESVLNGQTTETVVKIELVIEEKTTKFKPNFSASVQIETAQSDNALTVPYEAIYTTKEGIKKVFVVKDGKLAEQVIKTGVEGDLVVEALGESLKPGDQVVLNPTEELKDGDSVKLTSAGDRK